MDQLSSKNLISNADNINSANEKDGKVCALSKTNEIERCFPRPDKVPDNPDFRVNDDFGSSCLESKEYVVEEPEPRTSPLSKSNKYFSNMNSSNENEASISPPNFQFNVQQGRNVLNIRPYGLSLSVPPSTSTKPSTLSSIVELESDSSKFHHKETNIRNHTETFTSTLEEQKEVETHSKKAFSSNDDYREEIDKKIPENSGIEKFDSIEESLIHDSHGSPNFSLSQLNKTTNPDCLKMVQSNESDQRYSVAHTDTNKSLCNSRKKEFTKKRNLKADMLSKKELKPFKCDKCLKSFIQDTSLQIHNCSHMGDKTFACEVCEKSFTEKGNLAKHMRIHRGEKLFKCETCGKSFRQKCHLQTHLHVHTREKPFSCEICPKSFTQKGHLGVHMRTHNGEKPFQCETCGKSFTQKGNLTKHMRSHRGEKPFPCKTCGKSFARKDSLVVHMRIHRGEKPFRCETCGKSFNQKGNLQMHLHTHTREKEFICEDCGKRFKTKGNLNTHKKEHKP